ncbi:CopG family transcriptional regulator [Bacillus cereus]
MEVKEKALVAHLLELLKKVSITLPEEAWKRIEDSEKSYSQFFRDVTLKELKK